MNNIKRIWYLLDEIAIRCSARHMSTSCPICRCAIEAMKLCPEKPTPQECNDLYKEHNNGEEDE